MVLLGDVYLIVVGFCGCSFSCDGYWHGLLLSEWWFMFFLLL